MLMQFELTSLSFPPSLPLPLDFLPIFVWVLVQCGFTRAEIEAEYMWGLAHPSLFNGEAGYYLTTLTSAINVLKETQPAVSVFPSTEDSIEEQIQVTTPSQMRLLLFPHFRVFCVNVYIHVCTCINEPQLPWLQTTIYHTALYTCKNGSHPLCMYMYNYRLQWIWDM